MVPDRDIQAVVDQIVRKFKPDRVILFGSHAGGLAGTPENKPPRADSDVDLLVILPFEGHPASKASEIACAITYDFAMDLLVRTPEDAAMRYKHLDPIVRAAFDRGRIFYEKAA